MTEGVVRLEAGGRWPADVDIWHVAMPSAGHNLDESCLYEDERERAARYRQVADRVRFVATRLALRDLLGRYVDVEPAPLRFAMTRHGRPELAGFACLSF